MTATPVRERLDCCEPCLRRGALIGHLAPRVAATLAGGRDGGGLTRLLARPDANLIEAVCSEQRAREARAFLGSFDARATRHDLLEREVEPTCPHGEHYPAGLRDLADPPAALYVAGGLDRLGRLAGMPAATLVGSRRPSPYGREIATLLARGLAGAGVAVVSGLALGIDAAAHRGALAGGCAGIAVLGRGPDEPYPRTNAALYGRMRESGCVVSEFPPRTPVFRWSFPARNRIMAALGRVTVVVEADDPSGSLITARFAADLGRTVAAVPGLVGARSARGSNGLLRDGACVVLGAEDVLDELFGAGNAPEIPRPALPPLEPPLARVLEAVGEASPVADLCERTGLGPREVRAALGRLELLGLVRRETFGYQRVPR